MVSHSACCPDIDAVGHLTDSIYYRPHFIFISITQAHSSAHQPISPIILLLNDPSRLPWLFSEKQ